MEVHEFIMAIVNVLPDRSVHGRTVLQKLCYLCAKKLGDLDIADMFAAHYYGPYSAVVAAETSALVTLGFLEESSRLAYGGTRFDYGLTDEGRQIIDDLRLQCSEDFEALEQVMAGILKHEGIWKNVVQISAAAKVSFILEQSNRPMTREVIAECAAELGWKELDANRVDQVIAFLLDLGLASEKEDSQPG